MKAKYKSLIVGLFVAPLFLCANDSSNEINIERIDPIPVENIKYNKDLASFSLYKTNKDAFKEYINTNNISPVTLKKLYNRVDNPLSIKVSAYAFDYAYKRPDIAENFYSLFDKKVSSLPDKVRYMDYLIRTGRITEAYGVLKGTDCLKNLKYRKHCYYYLGVAKYLITGDNRNKYINLTRTDIDKAKDIYYGNI